MKEYEERMEFRDILDDAIKRELEHNPEIVSKEDKMLYIKENAKVNPFTLAAMVGIEEVEIFPYIKSEIPENLERRLNEVFATVSILRKHHTPKEVNKILRTSSNLFDNNTFIGAMERGFTPQVLYRAELDFRRLNEG